MTVDTTPAEARHLAVRFTGSGSEYFRIWIVNVLLTIVTLSLYYPFAKARQLAYFHANTIVGDEVLAFHGNPRKMLRGYLLVLLAWASYLLATRIAPAAAAILGLVFAALWPALWRAGLQFRLGNTSWRGVRMRFEGSLGDAYRAWAPLMLPIALMVVGTALAPQPEDEAGDVPFWVGLAPLAAMLLMAALGPWWMAATMRYRQSHSAWASERARFTAGTPAFYAGAARLIGLAVLIGGGGVALAFTLGRSAGPAGGLDVGTVVILALTYLAIIGVVWPYASARLQDLVWSHTESTHLQFHSRLGARKLAVVLVTNILLTGLTLGLFRPFAAVRTARLRLASISVLVSGEPQAWLGGGAPRRDDATGDFAGDFLGFDLGL